MDSPSQIDPTARHRSVTNGVPPPLTTEDLFNKNKQDEFDTMSAWLDAELALLNDAPNGVILVSDEELEQDPFFSHHHDFALDSDDECIILADVPSPDEPVAVQKNKTAK